ncbi:hypothetical protein [Methylobacterium sp. GC_Met_2]|uniref:hypothetical protein n=1 Tax=Methylobacterium sp. GC_Met_2 TaxID=2937376 RepID=UPI00226B3C69|nr:hypothetical protein [Methylobacterium sp. GC_Met_2]
MSMGYKMSCRLHAWIKVYDKDRIQGLEQCRSDLEADKISHREAKCEAVAFLAEFIRDVNNTPGLRGKLLAHAFFHDDARGPRKISTAAARLIFDVAAISGAEYELVRSYGDLAGYFASGNMEPQEVAGKLKQLGMAEFWRRIRATEKNEDDQEGVGPTVEDHDNENIDKDFTFGEKFSEIAQQPPRPAPKVATPDRSAVIRRAIEAPFQPKQRRPKYNPKTMLMVDDPNNLLARILETENYSSIVLRLRRQDKEEYDWKCFLIEEILDQS